MRRSIPMSTIRTIGGLALAAQLAACGERERSTSERARAGDAAPPPATGATETSAEDLGQKLYALHCVACHQSSGQGLPPAFPPLANADYFLDDPLRAASMVINGMSGPISVNGVEYNGVMPGFGYLNDAEIAALLTYALNAWGNDGGSVTAAQVAQARGG